MGAFIVVDLKLYVHPGTHVEDAEEIQNLVEHMIKKEVKNVSEVMVRITTIRDEVWILAGNSFIEKYFTSW